MTEPMPTWNNPSTDKWVMNSEPLSTKQLHEIITAQNMTIDRLLDDKSHYMEVVRKLYDDIEARKEMMNNYAGMCEGYREMNNKYKEMIDYYQQPQIHIDHKINVK